MGNGPRVIHHAETDLALAQFLPVLVVVCDETV